MPLLSSSDVRGLRGIRALLESAGKASLLDGTLTDSGVTTHEVTYNMTATDFLAEGGALAEKLPQYELRPQQVEMAEAVAGALTDSEHLLVEAGTGVGKSFAYLLPVFEHIAATGETVVVSTHTIALQEQLVFKDIPLLQEILGQEVSVELVKGRSNYLGLRRLARASKAEKSLFVTGDEVDELHAIEDWAYGTPDGSLADLPFQPIPSVWAKARSDGDDCHGRRCPHYKACFFQRARRRAESAKLLIVNHAMLFADLGIRRHGASALPNYDRVILDEAHTIETVAGDHLGCNITSGQIHFVLNNLYNERTDRGFLKSFGDETIVGDVVRTHHELEQFLDELAPLVEAARDRSVRLTEPPVVSKKFAPALLELRQSVLRLRESLDDEGHRSEAAAHADRCKSLADDLELWLDQKGGDWVYWLERRSGRSRNLSFGARPIDVGPLLKELLYDQVGSAVLTSATLATEGSSPFAYIKQRLGLEEPRELKLGSPFDLKNQIKAYVAADMPQPGDYEAFTTAVGTALKKYLTMSNGDAFVLFTSHAMMRTCAKSLAVFLEEHEMDLLVQDAGMPRSQMLDRFRTTPHSVLFGTDTFWAGVDVQGEALTNVIIVKLPFAPPDQPVVQARIQRIQKEGGNAFMQYQVPEAILKFRQGAGRLIRAKTDRGMLVVLDPRVSSKPYGKRFLRALPDVNFQTDQALSDAQCVPDENA